MEEGTYLLEKLADARWDTAARTFGSDHSTLIGLVIDWWISMDLRRHWALESGPSYGYMPKGKGRGNCDALLCAGENAVGILEVEGNRIDYTIRKIDNFLKSKDSDLAHIRFAILLIYPYYPEGRGKDRHYPPAMNNDISDAVKAISSNNENKHIIVLSLNKNYERIESGIRKRNEYYHGRPTSVDGYLYYRGKEHRKHYLFKSA